MGELIFLALIGIVGVLCYNETLSYSVAEYDRTGGPAMYPQLVLILLFIALALRAIQILMTKEKPKFKWFTLFKGSRGVFFIAFVLFVFLMDPLGFIVDATLFLTGTSLYLYYQTTGDKTLGGAKAITLKVVLFAAFNTAVFLFFTSVLNVGVPEGILGFLF